MDLLWSWYKELSLNIHCKEQGNVDEIDMYWCEGDGNKV
jgi:hypothetical protein